MTHIRHTLPVAPALALAAGFVVAPLVMVLRLSLCEPTGPGGRGYYRPGTWTLANWAGLFDPLGREFLRATLATAAAVALLSLALGYPLAWWLARLPAGRRNLALGLVLAPKMAGVLAALFGLQRLLPRGWAGSILAETFLVLPYAVLVLYTQFLRLDPQLIEAARGLGAGPLGAFCRVVWPLSLPGVFAAGQLAFAWGLGAALGPLFLGGPTQTTLALDLHQRAFVYGNWPAAAAAAGLVTVLAASAFALSTPVARRFRP